MIKLYLNRLMQNPQDDLSYEILLAFASKSPELAEMLEKHEEGEFVDDLCWPGAEALIAALQTKQFIAAAYLAGGGFGTNGKTLINKVAWVDGALRIIESGPADNGQMSWGYVLERAEK